MATVDVKGLKQT